MKHIYLNFNFCSVKAFFFLATISFLSILFQESDESLEVSFDMMYKGISLSAIEGESKMISDSAQIDVLKFYVSNLQLLDGSTIAYQEPSSFHLIDMNQRESLLIDLSIPKDMSYSRIVFDLGIDSLTSVSGVFGGDLDPTNGMYWTWQSGYINFKLEGKSSNCPSRNQAFQYHIGGYMNPYRAIRKISLEVDREKSIGVALHVDYFLDQMDLNTQHEVMSPNHTSMEIADILQNAFGLRI